tara:strand:+ start:1073 stop:1306 length:234 start_codon:yes stop_codon:yes gene_type:complete
MGISETIEVHRHQVVADDLLVQEVATTAEAAILAAVTSSAGTTQRWNLLLLRVLQRLSWVRYGTVRAGGDGSGFTMA